MNNMPARLTKEQVAECLGCRAHDIPVLVRAGLLRVLGRPSQQCVKYFAAVDIAEKSSDPKWLSRATDELYAHWRTNRNKAEGTTE